MMSPTIRGTGDDHNGSSIRVLTAEPCYFGANKKQRAGSETIREPRCMERNQSAESVVDLGRSIG